MCSVFCSTSICVTKTRWWRDAHVARCVRGCRARIYACRYRLFEHFCTLGYTALLAWLRKQVPLREARANRLCTCAARGGHLVVLQWLYANGASWDEDTCAHAARGGHLATLQWLHANGAPWDVQTCHYAARGGHVGTLQWLRANGAPWDERTCAWAAEGGISARCSGYAPMVRRGMNGRVHARP